MDTTKPSKEDIVKNFNLPERQSKINTILKMKNETPLYCICRSTYTSETFMIQCEKCEEWFHGDCIGLEQKNATSIRKWFCFECIQHHGLKIAFRNPKNSLKKRTNKKKPMSFRKMSTGYQDTENSQCGKCSNCLQNEECGNKFFNFHSTQVKLNRQRVSNKQAASRSHIARNPLTNLSHCYNTGCCKSRRLSSKYCSDECGLALARHRLMAILPHQIAEWKKVPCVADQLDKSKIDVIKMQQKLSIEKLKVLDKKEVELRSLIDGVKKLPISDNIPECEDSKMFCLVCGLEIPLQTAVKHMELCYKKFEGQFACIGSAKSNTASYHIFCDFFDARKSTYCKYLRYICPDHFKPMKPPESEVCGCPVIDTMSSDLFSNTKTFCQQAKQKCDQHYNWEYVAISEIDFERLKEMNKINQLMVEENIIVQQLKNRCGVLGLLLHSTSSSE